MTTEDFPDTIIAPRRREPMDFRPASYEAAHAAVHAFGALEGLVVVAWGIIAAGAAAAYLIWW